MNCVAQLSEAFPNRQWLISNVGCNAVKTHGTIRETLKCSLAISKAYKAGANREEFESHGVGRFGVGGV